MHRLLAVRSLKKRRGEEEKKTEKSWSFGEKWTEVIYKATILIGAAEGHSVL